MTYVAGIDEAGRGPVIGPMVMAIVACKDEEALRKRGMKDSKLLTAAQRDALAETLLGDSEIKHEVIALSPAEIDMAVQGKDAGDNLNRLEARTTALLIYRIAKRISLASVIIDSPTRNVASYERTVRELLDKIDREGVTKNVLLRAETKADFNHPVVGAASILAKTTRDEAIAQIVKKHGPIGTGYPSDPLTQAFLRSQWQEPHDFFRRSWATYQALAQAKNQSSLVDFDSEHKETIGEFEALREHGFEFTAPTNPYEVVRMKKDGVTVIRYTTGKLVVQGPDAQRKDAEALLAKMHLLPRK
jgi:ribonuclease HII